MSIGTQANKLPLPNMGTILSAINVKTDKKSSTCSLFLLGGGVNLTPPVVFLHNSKSIGLRLLKFSDFSYIPKALPLGLKPGYNINCLSPQAHCLNGFFFLLQTKSLFWPSSTCQILIKFSFLESLWHKETDYTSFAKKIANFLQITCKKGNLHIFSFSWLQIRLI